MKVASTNSSYKSFSSLCGGPASSTTTILTAMYPRGIVSGSGSLTRHNHDQNIQQQTQRPSSSEHSSQTQYHQNPLQQRHSKETSESTASIASGQHRSSSNNSIYNMQQQQQHQQQQQQQQQQGHRSLYQQQTTVGRDNKNISSSQHTLPFVPPIPPMTFVSSSNNHLTASVSHLSLEQNYQQQQQQPSKLLPHQPLHHQPTLPAPPPHQSQQQQHYHQGAMVGVPMSVAEETSASIPLQQQYLQQQQQEQWSQQGPPQKQHRYQYYHPQPLQQQLQSRASVGYTSTSSSSTRTASGPASSIFGHKGGGGRVWEMPDFLKKLSVNVHEEAMPSGLLPPSPPIPRVAEGQFKTAEPTENDVLCGRGSRVNNHKGNRNFRLLVSQYKDLYLAPHRRKVEKAHICAFLVDKVRHERGARFLKQDEKTKQWEDIGDAKARKKAGQALREDATEVNNWVVEQQKVHLDRMGKEASERRNSFEGGGVRGELSSDAAPTDAKVSTTPAPCRSHALSLVAHHFGFLAGGGNTLGSAPVAPAPPPLPPVPPIPTPTQVQTPPSVPKTSSKNEMSSSTAATSLYYRTPTTNTTATTDPAAAAAAAAVIAAASFALPQQATDSASTAAAIAASNGTSLSSRQGQQSSHQQRPSSSATYSMSSSSRPASSMSIPPSSDGPAINNKFRFFGNKNNSSDHYSRESASSRTSIAKRSSVVNATTLKAQDENAPRRHTDTSTLYSYSSNNNNTRPSATSTAAIPGQQPSFISVEQHGERNEGVTIVVEHSSNAVVQNRRSSERRKEGDEEIQSHNTSIRHIHKAARRTTTQEEEVKYGGNDDKYMTPTSNNNEQTRSRVSSSDKKEQGTQSPSSFSLKRKSIVRGKQISQLTKSLAAAEQKQEENLTQKEQRPQVPTTTREPQQQQPRIVVRGKQMSQLSASLAAAQAEKNDENDNPSAPCLPHKNKALPPQPRLACHPNSAEVPQQPPVIPSIISTTTTTGKIHGPSADTNSTTDLADDNDDDDPKSIEEKQKPPNLKQAIENNRIVTNIISTYRGKRLSELTASLSQQQQQQQQQQSHIEIRGKQLRHQGSEEIPNKNEGVALTLTRRSTGGSEELDMTTSSPLRARLRASSGLPLLDSCSPFGFEEDQNLYVMTQEAQDRAMALSLQMQGEPPLRTRSTCSSASDENNDNQDINMNNNNCEDDYNNEGTRISSTVRRAEGSELDERRTNITTVHARSPPTHTKHRSDSIMDFSVVMEGASSLMSGLSLMKESLYSFSPSSYNTIGGYSQYCSMSISQHNNNTNSSMLHLASVGGTNGGGGGGTGAAPTSFGNNGTTQTSYNYLLRAPPRNGAANLSGSQQQYTSSYQYQSPVGTYLRQQQRGGGWSSGILGQDPSSPIIVPSQAARARAQQLQQQQHEPPLAPFGSPGVPTSVRAVITCNEDDAILDMTHRRGNLSRSSSRHEGGSVAVGGDEMKVGDHQRHHLQGDNDEPKTLSATGTAANYGIDFATSANAAPSSFESAGFSSSAISNIRRRRSFGSRASSLRIGSIDELSTQMSVVDLAELGTSSPNPLNTNNDSATTVVATGRPLPVGTSTTSYTSVNGETGTNASGIGRYLNDSGTTPV